MNIRRGVVRLLVVGSGIYWLAVAASAVDVLHNPPDAPAGDQYVLQAADHRYYSVQAPPGASCQNAWAIISAEARQHYGVDLPLDACAHATESRAGLEAMQGRHDAMQRLGYALAVYAGLAAAVAAIWWVLAGFLARGATA